MVKRCFGAVEAGGVTGVAHDASDAQMSFVFPVSFCCGRVLFSIFAFACFIALAAPASARLGETEAQSQARYGAPTPELAAPKDKPLLEGAKEIIYHFEGWRVRAAFLNNTTARIEYVHLPENGVPRQVTEDEARAILDAEKGSYAWREEKPRTGSKELNSLKTALEGRRWERSDHAVATLKLSLLFVFETREVEAYEKRLGRQAKASPAPKANVPKF